MVLTLLTTALAGADDDTVRKLLSESMGRDVPSKYLCVERIELNGTGEVAVAGVKMKNRGCVLKGVVVGDDFVAPEKSLVAAVPEFSTFDSTERSTMLESWVGDVLLAFDQPIEKAIEGEAVVAKVLHRIPEPQRSAETVMRFEADKVGVITRTEGASTKYETGLSIKVNSAKEYTSAEAGEAVSKVGKLFRECVRRAWSDDLAAEGRTRMAWDVVGNKADNVTGRGWGPDELLRCYSAALRQIPYEKDGHLDVSFSIVRRAVE